MASHPRKKPNTRATAMWSVINKVVDFRNKSVTDLGYGSGVFLHRAYIAGARTVLGIDNCQKDYRIDSIKVQHTKHGTKEVGRITTRFGNLNDMLLEWKADIGLCFSVLPYLDDPQNFVNWMSNQFAVSMIECQYKGDGPGFSFIKDTSDMKYWLKNSFDNVTLIGNSYVVSKDLYRDIWMCTNDL